MDTNTNIVTASDTPDPLAAEATLARYMAARDAVRAANERLAAIRAKKSDGPIRFALASAAAELPERESRLDLMHAENALADAEHALRVEMDRAARRALAAELTQHADEIARLEAELAAVRDRADRRLALARERLAELTATRRRDGLPAPLPIAQPTRPGEDRLAVAIADLVSDPPAPKPRHTTAIIVLTDEIRDTRLMLGRAAAARAKEATDRAESDRRAKAEADAAARKNAEDLARLREKYAAAKAEEERLAALGDEHREEYAADTAIERAVMREDARLVEPLDRQTVAANGAVG